MPPTRASRSPGLVAGGAAAVLWWAANALAAHLTYDSTVPPAFAQLVLPAAVPGFTWVTPQPWPVLAPALSALAVGALVVWSTRLVRRVGAPRGIAVFAAWFGVVAASVIVGAAIGLGVTIANWPPPRAFFALDSFPGPVQAAAVWGAVWGWAPALLSGARRADAPRGAGRLLPAAVLGIVFTGLAVAGQASAQLPPPGAEPGTAAPTATPPATPIPTAAARADVPDPNWCSATQVELSLGSEDGAAGHRAITLTATNRTGVECVLDGYPDLAFGTANDALLAVHAVQGSSFGVQDPGPTAVRLGAGQSARSVLGWDAQPNDPAHQVRLIAAAPYPGAVRTLLPADVDLIAGADVGYTAWQPATP